ncbi:MAG: Smr/MutS family protein [Planctomycetes bacterium]|nr:Smr/MutS family protein [Planctomycetota bacterium]
MVQSPRIDLHGLDCECAEALIRRLVDDAQRAGDRKVEVVHGRGEGILAKLARDVLKANPKVSDLGVLDASQGCGVWARIRKASEMPIDRAAIATNGAAKTARDLLKQAKGLLPPKS